MILSDKSLKWIFRFLRRARGKVLESGSESQEETPIRFAILEVKGGNPFLGIRHTLGAQVASPHSPILPQCSPILRERKLQSNEAHLTEFTF